MVHKSIFFLCVWLSLKASVWFSAQDFCFVFYLLLVIIIVLFHVYEYVIFRYTSCVSGDYGGQKGVSHPLEVESQPVVRHVWVLGRKLGPLEGQQVL